jgi:hypothetical protein
VHRQYGRLESVGQPNPLVAIRDAQIEEIQATGSWATTATRDGNGEEPEPAKGRGAVKA